MRNVVGCLIGSPRTALGSLYGTFPNVLLIQGTDVLTKLAPIGSLPNLALLFRWCSMFRLPPTCFRLREGNFIEPYTNSLPAEEKQIRPRINVVSLEAKMFIEPYTEPLAGGKAKVSITAKVVQLRLGRADVSTAISNLFV